MTNLRIASNNTVTTNVYPLVGGGQIGATQLNYGYNGILDPTSNFDSVQLPLAISGAVVIGFIQDVNTNTLAVFAKEGTSDIINPSLNESIANDWVFDFPGVINDNQIMICTCAEDGIWTCNFWYD
jgi:hypothetical protein